MVPGLGQLMAGHLVIVGGVFTGWFRNRGLGGWGALPGKWQRGRGQRGELGRSYGLKEKQIWIQVGCLALHDILTHVISGLLVASVSLPTKQGMAVSTLWADAD